MSDSGIVSTRIVTTSLIDAKPPAFRVSWIPWDSGFAASGLRVGDQIIGVNGKPIAAPEDVRELQRTVPKSIGQYAESQTWADAGASAGTAVTLTVRRRKPDTGWETLDIQGTLVPEAHYSLPDGQQALSPAGPGQMEYDGFDQGWGAWYDQIIVQRCGAILERGWREPSFNNRVELTLLEPHNDRVQFLKAHYPGPFADSVAGIFAGVQEMLRGPEYHLTEADLRFRRAEEDKVQHARDLAAAAWAARLQEAEAATMPAFPAPHPIRGDRHAVPGKFVVLPPVRNSDWIAQAGSTFFAFGSESDGYYFADAEAPDAQAMLLALQRFRRLVTPSLDESYQILGRIRDEVSLRVVNGRGFYGFEVEIAAALVGEAMFADISRREGDRAPFAGEEQFSMPAHALPADSASPAEVMEAFIGALKTGDLQLWKALFADWSVSYLPDGRPLIYPHDFRIDENMWEDSRRNMLSRICDARVAWVDDPMLITTGDEFPNAPRIEEIGVELDLIGSFDGEYRRFASVGVSRFWKLQRIGNGPWRISSIQRI